MAGGYAAGEDSVLRKAEKGTEGKMRSRDVLEKIGQAYPQITNKANSRIMKTAAKTQRPHSYHSRHP